MDTNVYNLLIKVDSNTKGNTYWFMFNVSNIKVGNEVSFNIKNFTRTMKNFYQDKMNILTKTEKGEWRYKKCTKVQFGDSDLETRTKKYYHLSFNYRFTEEDAS